MKNEATKIEFDVYNAISKRVVLNLIDNSQDYTPSLAYRKCETEIFDFRSYGNDLCFQL